MSYRGRGSFGGYWGGYSPQPSSEFDVYGQYHSVNNLYGLSAFPPFPETLITDSGSSHGLPRITLGGLLYSHSFSFGLHPWSCVKSSLSPTLVVRIPNLHFSCINSCFKIIAYSWVLTNDSLTDYTFWVAQNLALGSKMHLGMTNESACTFGYIIPWCFSNCHKIIQQISYIPHTKQHSLHAPSWEYNCYMYSTSRKSLNKRLTSGRVLRLRSSACVCVRMRLRLRASAFACVCIHPCASANLPP